jgi:hypothetical protein
MKPIMVFKFLGALAPFLLVHLAAVDLFAADYFANFDDLPNEGAIGASFTDGGINFTGYLNDIAGPHPFIAEQANSADLGPAFSAPYVLGFGGYVPGPGEGFGRVSTVNFSAPTLAVYAQLDVWYSTFTPGNTLTLSGFRNGIAVQQSSFVETDEESHAAEHAMLSLTGGPFDSFRLSIAGALENGNSFLCLDNVRISPVPEPATCALAMLAAVGLFLLKRHR